jgi:hypothetical protein
MYSQLDYDSIFEIVNDEIVSPTVSTKMTVKNVKIVAPDSQKLDAPNATEFDFTISKAEYTGKKLIDTTIDAIDGLIKNTDYSLAFFTFTSTVTDTYPVYDDNTWANIMPAKLLELLAACTISPSTRSRWAKTITDFDNDTSKTRWFILEPFDDTQKSTREFYPLTSSIKFEQENYGANYNAAFWALENLINAVLGMYTKSTQTIVSNVYSVQVSYKIQLTKYTDIVTNTSLLQIVDSKLNPLITNIISKLPIFSIVKTDDYNTPSICNGTSKVATTLTYTDVSPNESFVPSGLSSAYATNPKTTTANKNISGQSYTVKTKKYTLKNSDESIFLILYYQYDITNTTQGSLHYLMIETWNGNPDDPNSKKLFINEPDLPKIMPNIGGESTTTLKNLSNGSLFISSSNDHICITSSWKALPTDTDLYHYGYLISKFTHNYSKWLTVDNISIITGTSILPSNSTTASNNIDSKSYTIEKYDPSTNTYSSSNYYDTFYYSNFNKSLVYVDIDNIKQFILIPIQIKDHSIGVFGNISEVSNVYMITGQGSDTIKNGTNITLNDGTKYIKFCNHAVKI